MKNRVFRKASSRNNPHVVHPEGAQLAVPLLLALQPRHQLLEPHPPLPNLRLMLETSQSIYLKLQLKQAEAAVVLEPEPRVSPRQQLLVSSEKALEPLGLVLELEALLEV